MASALSNIIKELTSGLNARQKEILSKRFCLDGKSTACMTLAELGDLHGITRERVRQIEASALRDVQKKIAGSKAKGLLSALMACVKNKDGVMAEHVLSAEAGKLTGTHTVTQLRFLLEAEGALMFRPEDNDLHAVWFTSAERLAVATKAIARIEERFAAEKSSLLAEKFSERTLSAEERVALTLSKKFGTNVYGDFGLLAWPEINPKTIRDRAYVVLKKEGGRAHFREIAKRIEKRAFDKKAVYASTVHNELIKDKRFVLVGRGVYALREHGFMPGTTRDVIARVLKNDGPLSAEMVVDRVSKERQFKENTILLNLQNKRHFRRLEDGRYRVNEA